MSGQTVAFRYARALHQAALEEGLIQKVMEDLSALEEIMIRVSSVKNYCLKIHADHLQEMAFIETAFLPYVSRLTEAMLRIAVRNGRLAVLPYLSGAFKKIVDDSRGIVEVTLESAHGTDQIQQARVIEKMQERLHKDIRMDPVVVPELLGGFRILWNNRMIDMSAAGRIKRMRAGIKVAE